MIESENLESIKQNNCGADLERNLATNDPGDETLKRFRFQISFAAILSIIMIDNEDYSEVFCEHHEDILLKHSDGIFTGIQVKTKDLNLPPFTIEDEAIYNSFKKFILLDLQFPLKFKVYSIVSNHGFDKSKPAVCINSLLSNVKEEVDILSQNTKVKKFINKLAVECKCSPSEVLETLKKVRLKTFCNLDDIHMKLINQLKKCSLIAGATESKLQDIADKLLAKHFKSSSLYKRDDTSLLGFITGNETDVEILEKIAQKKITCKDLKSWLEEEKILPVKLLLKDRQVSSETRGHQRLQVKMDAGGIDSENIDTIRDFKFAFEQHTASWLYKNDLNNNDDSQARYDQILAITKNVCKEIYDEYEVNKNFDLGQKMLVGVRKGIKDRSNMESDVFFDCSYEHILGAVGVLTEACKVWWSPKFEIE